MIYALPAPDGQLRYAPGALPAVYCSLPAAYCSMPVVGCQLSCGQWSLLTLDYQLFSVVLSKIQGVGGRVSGNKVHRLPVPLWLLILSRRPPLIRDQKGEF